jgi:nitric oxide reductase subunit B
MMALLTLLPMGTLQLLAAINEGYWYARSEQFMQRPIIELLVWMRVPGDTVFAFGALAFTWFVASLWLRPRREPHEIKTAAEEVDETERARAA